MNKQGQRKRNQICSYQRQGWGRGCVWGELDKNSQNAKFKIYKYWGCDVQYNRCN